MALVAGLPLFQLRLMDGHDTLAYPAPAADLWLAIRAGVFYPRWLPNLNGGYGQPYFLFRPPVFYYLTIPFRALGSSVAGAESFAIFALIVMAGIGAYGLAADHFGVRAGLLSAAATLFAPYFLAVLYVRHNLHDLAAFAFIPLTFWALSRAGPGMRRGILAGGAIAAALLILSSNTVALIVYPALIGFAAWLWIAERDGPTLARRLGMLALGVGLSAFFWLPALAEGRFTHLAETQVGYYDYRDHFVYLDQLLVSAWGYGYSYPGRADGMSFAVGGVQLALSVAALAALRGLDRGRRWLVAAFLIALAVAMLMTTPPSRPLWALVPILHNVQFPWRFLSLIVPCCGFLAGVATALPDTLLPLRGSQIRGREGLGVRLLHALSTRPALTNAWTLLILGGLIAPALPHIAPRRFLDAWGPEMSDSVVAIQSSIVTGTINPIWSGSGSRPTPDAPVWLADGAGRLIVTAQQPGRLAFDAEITEEARLLAQVSYFPGWRLWTDGVERPVEVAEPVGNITFTLESGMHHVRLEFRNTPVRWVGDGISAASLIALTAFLIRGRFRSRWSMRLEG